MIVKDHKHVYDTTFVYGGIDNKSRNHYIKIRKCTVCPKETAIDLEFEAPDKRENPLVEGGF